MSHSVLHPAVISYAECPELWQDTAAITREVWPEYNQHGDVLGHYWVRLYEEFADFQFALYDESRAEVLAEGHTVPCPWDGTADGLGEGIDATIAAAFRARAVERPAAALCALAIEIRPRFQGRGLAQSMLDAMGELTRGAGLAHLIAPVRPSFKDRYPLVPIESYASWTRADGAPFDPWIRVHVRRGGAIVRPIPHSLRISATIGEWEAWTGMDFPDDGSFTFPAGLAPVEIDHARNRGTYWEPNVWIVHDVRA